MDKPLQFMLTTELANTIDCLANHFRKEVLHAYLQASVQQPIDVLQVASVSSHCILHSQDAYCTHHGKSGLQCPLQPLLC